MSSEHDRLLAQGPRTAPEPRMVADDGSLTPVSAVVPDTTEQAKPLQLPGGSSRRTRPGLGRRLVPLLVALGIAGRTIGHGRWQIGLFIAIAVAVVTVLIVQKAREL